MSARASVTLAPQAPVEGPTGWTVAALAAFLAALHLGYPLDVDQGLFVAMGREMVEGARLYRDFWDMKQPAVYWWYEAAGALFGHDAPGLRWMDLCWAVGTTLIVWATVRRRGNAVALLAPAIGVASFYGRVSSWHLSQLEWILCAPIAAVVWCMNHPAPTEPRTWPVWRYGAAGVLIGVVGVFKLLLAVVPLAVVCVASASTLRRLPPAARRRTAVLASMFALLAGFAAAVLPALLWLHLQGTLPAAIWTTFVLPGQLLAEYHHNPPIYLYRSARWFLVGTWAFWPPAIWAMWNGLRDGRRLELLYATWLVIGLGAIAIQILSFWEYQFGMLFVPLGALAAFGAVDVWSRTRPRPSLSLRLWIACMVLCVAWPIGRKMVYVAKALPFDQAHREAFEDRIDPLWPVLRASAAVARTWMKDGDRVVVWGDQRMVGLLGEHRPVMQINGDVFYTAAQIRDCAAWLDAHRPPLVYVSKHRDAITYHGGDAFPSTVKRLYVPFNDDSDGVWYRLAPNSLQNHETDRPALRNSVDRVPPS